MTSRTKISVHNEELSVNLITFSCIKLTSVFNGILPSDFINYIMKQNEEKCVLLKVEEHELISQSRSISIR